MTRTSIVLLAAVASLFAALSHFLARQIGDDAFIFFRVVENLAAGDGPVFNVGERVEAYSSPLWLFVLYVARACGADLVLFSRWVGTLLTASAVSTGFVLARRLGGTATAASLSCVAAALTGSLYYWAPSGLETSMHVLLVATMCSALVGKRNLTWSLATALVGVARPEGMALVLVSVVAYGTAHGWRALRPVACAIATLPASAYLAFRLVYFGVFFPNTYYAKATGSLFERLGHGIDYAFWLSFGILGAVVITLRRGRLRERRLELGVLFFIGSLVTITVVGGGDWMWGHRLTLPAYLPLFAVFAAQATDDTWTRPIRPLAVVFALMLLTINDDLPWAERLGYPDWFGFDAAENVLAHPGRALSIRFVRPVTTLARALSGASMDPGERIEGTMTDASKLVGTWLRDNYPQGTLLAVNHAGAVPYFARFQTIDMVGLADAHIAREVKGGLHMKFDPDYIVRRAPEIIVLNTRVEPGSEGLWYHDGYWEGETALVHNPEFLARYRALPRTWRWEWVDRRGNWIVLYERTD
jgi:hypothetical protein